MREMKISYTTASELRTESTRNPTSRIRYRINSERGSSITAMLINGTWGGAWKVQNLIYRAK